jgi:NAD(P)-dependent dehydrogenase (short-subunit alcohol dehydrogenase family)
LRPGALETLSADDWQITMGVNLNGCLFCAQSFGRQMLERRRGAIIHIASIAGSHAQGFSGAYSVSKAGIIMLSRQLATEWGPRGIRSNVVSPGMIRTPLSEAFYLHQDVLERRSRMTPIGRVGQPEDIANTVTYLASDRASYVSGEEITVDGAYTRTIMDLVPRPGFERPRG